MKFKNVAVMLIATILTVGGTGVVANAAIAEDTVFVNIEGYANVRSEASLEGEVVGKFYEGAKGKIVGMQEDWYKISSGNVEGYVRKDLVVTGEAANTYAKEVGEEVATVNADTLYVRESASTEAKVLESVGEGTTVTVQAVEEGWVKAVVNGEEGYLSSDYVTCSTVYKTAETLEEEQARIEEENRSGEGAGNQIVNYAMQFLGNPYVWGGTSLTNGTDCSGFTQSVYAHFGYDLPRTSYSQDDVGTEVSTSNMQPGDLLFYSRNGRVNHVAMYIGGGEIIHASSPSTGIKISNYDYRSPVKVVRIL